MPTGAIALLRTLAGAVPALPARLTGPIFTKELRVSARRKRNVVLRVAYLAVLGLVVVSMWLGQVRWGDASGAAGIARMARAGKAIVATIVWCQFVALQLVAVVVTSTSISDEVYNRTLGVLMTTPITSFQIVMGKLLSRLLHLLLLVALGLPLLAVVRVFGGVDTGYVVAGLCVTLSAAILAGATTMFFSIVFRRAYQTILVVFGIGLLVYLILPIILTLAMAVLSFGIDPAVGAWITLFAAALHPYFALAACTVEMFEPGATATIGLSAYWLAGVNCIVGLALAAGILLLCTLLVRRLAMRRVLGAAPAVRAVVVRRRRAGAGSPAPASSARPAGAIRPVRGPAMVWRELRNPMIRNLAGRIAVPATAGGLLVLTYALAADFLDCEVAQSFYGVILLGAALFVTAVTAAACISSEKEARTWPILLASPLRDWEILGAKALGVVRRSLPTWLFLIGHLVLFSLCRCIHPVGVVLLWMLIVGLWAFLTGMGLYCSARFRKTTAAVVTSLGACLALWFGMPFLTGMLDVGLFGGRTEIGQIAWAMNPFAILSVVLGGACGAGAAASPWGLRFSWVTGQLSLTKMTLWMVLFAGAYAAAGAIFAWRARRLLRRNVF